MARILLVDDASFMKLVEKEILEKNGHTIIAEAANGQEAIERYDEHKPDVVIMDIKMPEVNGIEALLKIKENDPEARVIMVSALGEPRFIKKAIELGAADFVVKPFKRERIVEAIEKVVNQ